jgi:Bifunctional DNA primase/polymerase, N-terminal
LIRSTVAVWTARRRRWREEPNANIGIRTGDGRLVFDVDPRNGGDDSLDELQRVHGALPDSWADGTPGGGTHQWFTYPRDVQIQTKTKLFPGIDIKAQGGYAVAPPSVRRDGAYVWLAGYAPEDLPIADAPPWLLEMLSDASRAPVARPHDTSPCTHDRPRFPLLYADPSDDIPEDLKGARTTSHTRSRSSPMRAPIS